MCGLWTLHDQRVYQRNMIQRQDIGHDSRTVRCLHRWSVNTSLSLNYTFLRKTWIPLTDQGLQRSFRIAHSHASSSATLRDSDCESRESRSCAVEKEEYVVPAWSFNTSTMCHGMAVSIAPIWLDPSFDDLSADSRANGLTAGNGVIAHLRVRPPSRVLAIKVVTIKNGGFGHHGTAPLHNTEAQSTYNRPIRTT